MLDVAGGTFPHSLEAERAVLGSILLDEKLPNSALQTSLKLLSSSDFFSRNHQVIYRALISLSEARQPADLFLLVDHLTRSGQIEEAGGTAYVSTLMDGLPRVSNVSFYCEVIAEKSSLRKLAYWSEGLSKSALAPNAKLSELRTQVRDAIALSTPKSQAGLKTVVTSQLLSAEIPAREDLLAPIFKTQSLSMVYSKRGTGKTFFCLAIAHAIASGGGFLGWTSPRPRGVLYVDAELPVATLQERVLELSPERIDTISQSLNLDLLGFITPDLQSIPMPDLGTRQGQILIEDQINGHELLVLDNLSALVRSGKENEGEGWLPVPGMGAKS